MDKIVCLLREHRIRPTPQRMATAKAVLTARTHPSADQIWRAVQRRLPTASRATVYNTLRLFVQKGLLKTQILKEGRVVFDPCVAPHHHFIDEASGQVHDIPWDALRVTRQKALPGFEVRQYQVVLRGRRTKTVSQSATPGLAQAGSSESRDAKTK